MSPPLVVGLGARPHTAGDAIEAAIRAALTGAGLEPGDVAALATLDRRAAEEGVRAVAAGHGWRLIAFTAAELAAQPVPNRSETVAAAVGTPSVAEAAAIVAAGAGASLIVPKRVFPGITVAVAG
ncbi:cobalamin biosynthesis protein [Actinoplanes subtropicus]|uniref:cobalamin biosynthesis protein n=1 Tax=Actinoplanes subtropicus TaxID=543632 RepID=UPI00147038F6|nr:cobalamin biosynthesis protein [Actinoplanes subtropicus]